MSRRALSIFVRAAAICAAVGSVASSSISGATSITQAWRVSGVVASSSSLASTSVSATVMPSVVARPAWIRVSMMRSSAISTTLWRCCSTNWLCWSACSGLSRPAFFCVAMRRSASCRRQSSMSTRSRSSSLEMAWPLDAADRHEVVVVVGQAHGDAEDHDGGQDDQSEADVEVEVLAVATLPVRLLGSLHDGSGSKGHRVVGSLRGWWVGIRRDRARSIDRSRPGGGYRTLEPGRPRRAEAATDSDRPAAGGIPSTTARTSAAVESWSPAARGPSALAWSITSSRVAPRSCASSGATRPSSSTSAIASRSGASAS